MHSEPSLLGSLGGILGISGQEEKGRKDVYFDVKGRTNSEFLHS